MSPADRLRSMADQATPGPWRISQGSQTGNANYVPVVDPDRRMVDMPKVRDAPLIALSPELARWAADASDALAELDHSDEPCCGECIAERKEIFAHIQGADLLARLAEIVGDK